MDFLSQSWELLNMYIPVEVQSTSCKPCVEADMLIPARDKDGTRHARLESVP